MTTSKPPSDRAPSGEVQLRERGLSGGVVFLIALVPRLIAAVTFAGEPVWDGHYYDFGAKRIAAGFGYSDDVLVGGIPIWHPWCHYPVGYSGFLAIFYRIFGHGTLVAPTVGAVVGAGLAWVGWALARLAMGPRRALIAGLLIALHPGLILYSALVMTEPLAALLTLLAFWIFARDVAGDPALDSEARDSHSAWRWRWTSVRSAAPNRVRGLLLGAFVLGLATLVRPQALLCAPVMGLLYPSRPSLPRLKRWTVAIAGAALTSAITLAVILPWTARNCHVMDGCALVSTNAGWNLAIGAFPRATGRFETLRSTDGCREVTGQVQQDRCWFAYGVEQIKAQPRFWLSLIPKKLSYTFDHESFAVEYLHEARPWQWSDARRSEARSLLTFVHRVLLALAAFGCIGFARPSLSPSRPMQRRATLVQGVLLAMVVALIADALFSNSPTLPGSVRVWPLALFVAIVPWLPLPGRPHFPPALLLPISLLATTVATHAVFFGEDRYHMVITPVLGLLVAAAFRGPPAAHAGEPE